MKPKIRMELALHPTHSKVFVDDVDISGCVRRATVKFDTDGITIATIEVFPDLCTVELPVEVGTVTLVDADASERVTRFEDEVNR